MTISIGQVWTGWADTGGSTLVLSGTATTDGSTLALYIPSRSYSTDPTISGFTLAASHAAVGHLYSQVKAGAKSSVTINWPGQVDIYGGVLVEIKSTQGTFTLDGTPLVATSPTITAVTLGPLTTTHASVAHNDICLMFPCTFNGNNPNDLTGANSGYTQIAGSDSTGSGFDPGCFMTSAAYSKTITTDVTAESPTFTTTIPCQWNGGSIAFTEAGGTFPGSLFLYAVDYGTGEACGPFFRNPLG